MLRVGIIGAGQMGRIHAGALVRTGLVEITAVYDKEREGQHLATTYGAKLAASPEEFFALDLDAVVIATPTHTHAEYLELAQRAHLHIFCEKPLVRTQQELERVETLLSRYEKVVMVGHTVRFFPEYQYAQDVLRNEELGPLGVVRLARCRGFDLQASSWLYDFAKSGGVVLDMMIHDLDFIEWAAGPVRSVFARRAATESLENDYCLVVGRLDRGALFHIEASWAEPPHTFYYAYEIDAQQGILDFDSRRDPAYAFRRRRPAHCVSEPGFAFTPTTNTPYERQAQAFVKAVIEGTSAPVSLTEGARAVRLALAVLESAATGQPVNCIEQTAS